MCSAVSNARLFERLTPLGGALRPPPVWCALRLCLRNSHGCSHKEPQGDSHHFSRLIMSTM